QIELLQELNQIVRGTECFRAAETKGKLIRVPSGDGMALLFFHSPEEPVRCALEISRTLQEHPHIQLRMGVHSGPVNQVTAVSDRPVIAPRWPKYVVIAVLLLSAVALAISFSVFYRRGSPVVAHSSSGKAADVGLPIAEKSIAVLPFENRSEEKATAYFAEGIQDEILTRLSKIADLKVISRTSTQQYQSKPGNLSEIAKQLGVAHIVEGSV